jgi:hypothetical protein
MYGRMVTLMVLQRQAKRICSGRIVCRREFPLAGLPALIVVPAATAAGLREALFLLPARIILPVMISRVSSLIIMVSA